MNIYPYKMESESSKALAAKLGVKRIKLEGSKFKPQGKVVVNWGSSSVPAAYLLKAKVVNPDVSTAVNKLKFFQAIQGEVYCIPFTTSKEEAKAEIEAGHVVVCRTKLSSHSGDGIVIAETIDQLVDAPLYTRYIKKETEYRIHIGNGRIFFEQKKARSHDVPDEQVNWKVRNLAGGFIFAHQGVDIPEPVKASAIACMKVLGLDFGAVDVLYNAKSEKAYTLEVNCAPGLQGTTLDKYAEMLRGYE